jgi:hypothetical protein
VFSDGEGACLGRVGAGGAGASVYRCRGVPDGVTSCP